MISFFPTPYPDENLHSVVARYHLASGNLLFRQTMEELFGVRRAELSPVIPQKLKTLAERVSILPLEQLLLNHTMFPYYMAFATKKNEDTVRNWVMEGQAGSVDVFLNQFGARIPMVKHLRFCPECCAEELERYGEGYWHREHQTPGVLFCRRHHHPLAETAVPYLIRDRNGAIPASARHLFPAVYPASLSPLGARQAIQIANDIGFLYENHSRIRAAFVRHQYSFRHLYLFPCAGWDWRQRAVPCGWSNTAARFSAFLRRIY